eukprot:gene9778-7000_t
MLSSPSSASPSILEHYRRSLQGVDVDDITRFSGGVEGEIMRDVLRTFQTQTFFQEGHLGRRMLLRILMAVSKAADASVGYCQGMNFVVGTMLQCAMATQQEDLCPEGQQEFIESLIFDLMLALIAQNGKLSMVGLWAERIPRLKLRVYQLDRLLRWFCPHLHAHFADIDLSPEVLTAQWFITLFGYSLGTEDTMRVWDYVFLGGWEGLFRIAVALLAIVEQSLLQLADMEGVSMLMKRWRTSERGMLGDGLSIDALFQRASSLIITDEVLLKLQEAYAYELLLLGALRCKELHVSPEPIGDTLPLEAADPAGSTSAKDAARDGSADRPTYWLQRYAYKLNAETSKELMQMKRTLRRLDAQIDTDKQQLSQKILTACESQRIADERCATVAHSLDRLESRRNRLQRRLTRCLDQAAALASDAQSVLFAMQQVEKLDEELRRLQASGKAPASQASSLTQDISSKQSLVERVKQRLRSYHSGGARKLPAPSLPQGAVANNGGAQRSEIAYDDGGDAAMTVGETHRGALSQSLQRLRDRLYASSSSAEEAGTSNLPPSIPRISKRQRLRALLMPPTRDQTAPDSPLLPSLQTMVHGLQELVSPIAAGRDSASSGSPSGGWSIANLLPSYSAPASSSEDFADADIGSFVAAVRTYVSVAGHQPLSGPLMSTSTSTSARLLHPGDGASTKVLAPSPSNASFVAFAASSLVSSMEPVASAVIALHPDEATLVGELDDDSDSDDGLPPAAPSDPPEPQDQPPNEVRAAQGARDPQLQTMEEEPSDQLRRLEQESRAAQRRIILLQRVIAETERLLRRGRQLLSDLQVKQDEAAHFKSRLCDQLHLLVEDSNRGRSQKLLYVADHYII